MTLGVARYTIVPIAVTALDTPKITMAPAQEDLAITTAPDTPAIVMPPVLTNPAATNLATITETEYELSVSETALPAQPTTNEGKLGASYLNNYIHQVVQMQVSLCAVLIHMHMKTLKVF